MVTRISGFSNTGIDIDDTVKKLIAAARIPQDKLKQQKQSIEWQRDDYRAMNAKIMDFRNAAFNMKLQASYQAKKSTSADESTVSVSSTTAASDGIYSLKVNKLATSASVTSAKVTPLLTPVSESNKLSVIDASFTDNTTLTIGGEKGTATVLVKPTDSIATLVAAVNGKSSTTGVSMSYDANIDKFFFVSSTTGSNAKIDLKMGSNSNTQNLLASVLKLPIDDGDPLTTTPFSSPAADAGKTTIGGQAFASGSSTLIDKDMTTTQKLHITVNGKTGDFEISKTTTVGKLIDQINSSDIGKSGVSAYLDSNNKLAFMNPDKGNAITFSDTTVDAYNVMSKLGLDATTELDVDGDADGDDYSTYTITGSKAEIVFNGASASYDTNTFSINGMTFTAKKEGGAAVNITTTRDVDSVFNSIKGFIDKYNDLVSSVDTKLTEKKYRDFAPLTDEQREAMDEDQIKTWESKAKSGTLRSDSLLTRGLSNFRSAFSNAIQGLPTGDAKSLSEIGISSTLLSGGSVSGSYSENGKIYIDEAKLKKAIAEKPDEVMALFNSTDGLKDSSSGDGLATRLYDKATSLIDSITAKSGASTSVDTSYLLGKTTIGIDKRIDKLSLKLEALETRYYTQFTAMEKYITQMQAQSSQLSSQFG